MVILHSVASAYGLPSISPFCSKLECWLRLAQIPYTKGGDGMARAPKGKVPWVELDGECIGDSQLIIERLAPQGVRLDAHLTPAQHAQGHLMRRAVEEGLYFALAYGRWVPDDAWREYRKVFETLIPWPVAWLVVPMIRRDVRKALHAQGTGRHSAEAISAAASADLDAITFMLGQQDFLFGALPSTYDCSVWAMLDGIQRFPVTSPVQGHLRSHANLVAYCDRMRARVFPELT